MTPDRWQLVSRIYHEAAAQPPDRQDEFVREASAGDSEVEREVRSLLRHAPDESFLVASLDLENAPVPALTGRLGRFELRGLIGAGGMGDVYRAHDDSLDRDVALKLLPRAFTSDPDRLARFEREARILAALNHPHIGAIYGVDAIPPRPGTDESGGRALVLELVEGETLAERLERGAMPLAEAREAAAQIADALEAAHDKGIVHRDLKPANIKIRADGTVKVLDFGLAKPVPPPGEERPRPGVPPPAGQTIPGLILGTPAYMSPEQARGHAVDKRTDIWAFGCVLYEMLAGRPAFGGDTPSDIIAAVLEREPNLSALPAATPAGVRRVIARCLVKDPRRRLRDIGDARADLEAADPTPPPAPRRAPFTFAIPWIVAAAAIAAAAWLAIERLSGGGEESPADRSLERVTYDSGLATTPALSPDGRLIAYASDRAGRGDLDIWVQQIGGGVPLRLTDDPADDHSPDFSPDGKQIAFRSARDGGGVYIAAALGGPQRLVVPEGRRPRFSPDGSRLTYWIGAFRGLASGLTSRLFVIALGGGAPVQVAPEFEVALDPVWAPDGRSLLFLGRPTRASPPGESFDWWWAPLDRQPPVKTAAFNAPPLSEIVAIQGVGSPAAWTRDGVLFTAHDNLWTMPMSVGGRRTGPPRRLTNVTGRAELPSMGPDGGLVFAVTHTQRAIERLPLEDVGGDPPAARVYVDNRSVALRASATSDGATVVFEQGFGGYYEIWALDARTGRQQMVLRVTARFPVFPTVSQDGARLAYTVSTPSAPGVQGDGYVLELAGGVARPICEGCRLSGFLSDHRRVLATWDQNRVIGAIDVSNGSRAELIRDPIGTLDRPHTSPDDRWLVFRHRRGDGGIVYIAPLSPNRPAAPSTWQAIEQPTSTGRPCGWSLHSPLVYLLLDTDGFRCVWGQRIDSRTGRLDGAVFPVRHMHEQMETTGPSTSLGNPVTAAGFLYERTFRAGDIWRLTRGTR